MLAAKLLWIWPKAVNVHQQVLAPQHAWWPILQCTGKRARAAYTASTTSCRTGLIMEHPCCAWRVGTRTVIRQFQRRCSTTCARSETWRERQRISTLCMGESNRLCMRHHEARPILNKYLKDEQLPYSHPLRCLNMNAFMKTVGTGALTGSYFSIWVASHFEM